MKTLDNTTANQAAAQVKDIKFWGNGDTFKLISKASSEKEGWMKSTKAMEIEGVGCVVQVSTQQFCKSGMRVSEVKERKDDGTIIWKNLEDCEHVLTSSVAEAVTFVPNVKIEEIKDGDVVIQRKLVSIN